MTTPTTQENVAKLTVAELCDIAVKTHTDTSKAVFVFASEVKQSHLILGEYKLASYGDIDDLCKTTATANTLRRMDIAIQAVKTLCLPYKFTDVQLQNVYVSFYARNMHFVTPWLPLESRYAAYKAFTSFSPRALGGITVVTGNETTPANVPDKSGDIAGW